jgi:hypothetical protein
MKEDNDIAPVHIEADAGASVIGHQHDYIWDFLKQECLHNCG